MVRDDFESCAKLARVESNARYRRDDSVTLTPPRSIGIAHDLAHARVQQERLDRTKKWKDQIKAHDEYLCRRRTGLSGRLLPGILVFRAGLLSPVKLQDRIDANFPDAPLEVGILGRDFAAAQLAFDLDM